MKAHLVQIFRTLKDRGILLFIITIIVFASLVVTLFSRERTRLDTEYQALISESLNVHTDVEADDISAEISETGVALQAIERIISNTNSPRTPQEIIAFIQRVNPAYTLYYATEAELLSDTFQPLSGNKHAELTQAILNGNPIVSSPFVEDVSGNQVIAMLQPIQYNGKTDVIYTTIPIERMLANRHDVVTYQDVVSAIVTADGKIVYHTFDRLAEHLKQDEISFFDSLSYYQLNTEKIASIAHIIETEEADSVSFERGGELYYVSSAKLGFNDWHLVSFVRGPDILIGSASVFNDMVRISTMTFVIAATLFVFLYLQLFTSNRKLRKEQYQNNKMLKRLQAMFNQHTIPKVAIDPLTFKLLDANHAAEVYFGVSKESAIGNHISEFNLLGEEAIMAGFEALKSGEPLYFAAPHQLADGTIRYLDVYGSLVDDGEEQFVDAILMDTTDREEYRNDLFAEKEFLNITLQSIGDGVVTVDTDGHILMMNPIAEQMTGWSYAEAKAKPFSEIFILENEETGEPVENPIQTVLNTGNTVGLANHTLLLDRYGNKVPIADSAAPILTKDGKQRGVVMVFRDVSEEKEHNRKIEYLSSHDALTKLYNRYYLEQRIGCFEKNLDKSPVSVIMADVNGLKMTNDVFGHKIGDNLLVQAAEVLRTICPENAIIARWGGDEFVVLMPGVHQLLAERITRKIKTEEVAIEGSSLPLSLSLGCMTATNSNMTITGTMIQAEKYMYQQKLLNSKSYRNSIISSLLATLYEKSNETEEHSKRLEGYCHAIGEKLGFSSKEMDDLSLLAMLHDIGKVGIETDVLKKPSALTNSEWEEMRRHPEIGYRIARETPELAGIAEFILSHHERYDGKGYPHGLKADEIPLVCRIIAVVDAYDAMTNDRVYRHALAKDVAIQELIAHSGTQFDPEIVNLLIEILGEESIH